MTKNNIFSVKYLMFLNANAGEQLQFNLEMNKMTRSIK